MIYKNLSKFIINEKSSQEDEEQYESQTKRDIESNMLAKYTQSLDKRLLTILKLKECQLQTEFNQDKEHSENIIL